jgi:hypothetical protein
MHLLALDWAKAFDSINTDALLHALRRFGLPGHVLENIASIYKDRVLVVNDCGVNSGRGRQSSGICQGCPLSPFLFVIVMTVLLEDARSSLSLEASEALNGSHMFEILYADDTLIMGSRADLVEEFAAAVEKAGNNYGMTLHWGKTQALSICTDSGLRRPDVSRIESKGSLQYLGGCISDDGRVDSELSRKIGVATGDFRSLSSAWGHAGISRRQKVRYLQSIIVSKLLYGLSSVWLVTAQRRRLDGFHARCLRRLLRIPASYVSRVSNAEVLVRAGVRPLSEQLLLQQLCLFGKAARASEGSPMRVDTFRAGGIKPVIGHFIRKRGRPRQDWTNELLKVARNVARASGTTLEGLIENEVNWKTAVHRFCQ